MHTPGKREWAKPHRGFESPSLRHLKGRVVLAHRLPRSEFFMECAQRIVGRSLKGERLGKRDLPQAR
jgi:hypothetical protein